jgi:hypothetical protein
MIPLPHWLVEVWLQNHSTDKDYPWKQKILLSLEIYRPYWSSALQEETLTKLTLSLYFIWTFVFIQQLHELYKGFVDGNFEATGSQGRRFDSDSSTVPHPLSVRAVALIRIPIKPRATIVFPLISIPNWSEEGRGRVRFLPEGLRPIQIWQRDANFQFSMTFNFNNFLCFSNIWNNLSNFSYLVCISCEIFICCQFNMGAQSTIIVSAWFAHILQILLRICSI